MVTNNKPQSQFLIKFLAIALIILAGISNCEKIFSDENVSEERQKNRIKSFNDWFMKFNPSSKVEAKLGSDKKIHLIAKSAIKAEENYFTFNRNLTINPDLVYNTKIGGFVKELEENFGYDDNLNMVLFIVLEMGNAKSEWKPYLDVLPRKLDTLAFNYWARKAPIEEEILHTPFLKKLVDYKISVERKAQSLNDIIRNKTLEEVFDREIFNSENLEWAMMILDTKANQVGFESLLVPMLDMVNIKEYAKNPSRTMKLRFEENGNSEVKSQSDVAKGSEVFDNLPLNSDDLLLRKGIINENNFHDCYSFNGNFEDRSKQDGLAKFRNVIFSRYFLFDENEKVEECISTKDPFSTRFLFFFYVSMLDEIELDREDIKRIGLEEDRVVLQYVKNALQSILDLYPTTLKSDLERVRKTDIEADKKTSIIYMIEQKRYLVRLIEVYENEVNRLVKEDTL